jgi:hypothetical protein
MADFKAKIEDNKCIIYNTGILGVIEYDDKKKIEASLALDNMVYRAEPGADKNIVISLDGTELLKFRFDYLWGGATLIAEGEKTPYKITGKALKKGTRLIDGDNNDMIVVKTVPDAFSMAEFEIEVQDPQVTDFLIVATVYYHIYASIGKHFIAVVM